MNFIDKIFRTGSLLPQKDLFRNSGRRPLNIKRRNAIQLICISSEDIYDIYKRFGVVNTIINRISGAAGSCPIWISKDAVEFKDENTELFKQRIANPNRKNRTNFLGDVIFEYALYGVAFIRRIKYRYGEDEFVVIPNYNINHISVTIGNFGEEVSFLKYNDKTFGTTTEIEVKGSDVFVIGKLTTEAGSVKYQSKIHGCKDELETYANLVDVLGESYGNGGARKIISFKNTGDDLAFNTPLENDKDALSKELRERYGGNSGDEMYVLSQNDVSVSDLSSKVTDFDAYNILNSLECLVCNAFDFPVSLFGLKSGAYKSQTEAEKSLYVGCITPIADVVLRGLDNAFGTEIFKSGAKIELDYSGLDFFQAGKQQQGAALQTFMQGAVQAIEAGVLTKEEVRAYVQNIL